MSNINGMCMEPLAYTRECETGCLRAVPSFEEFAKVMDSTLGEDANLKLFERGKQMSKDAMSHYNWDKTAEIWIDHFKSIPIKPDDETWRSKSQIIQPSPVEDLMNLLTFCLKKFYLNQSGQVAFYGQKL